MSIRSMLEFNHDETPYTEEETEKWVRSMISYLSSGDPETLPDGVTWFGTRHHTDECPLGTPPKGWNNKG